MKKTNLSGANTSLGCITYKMLDQTEEMRKRVNISTITSSHK